MKRGHDDIVGDELASATAGPLDDLPSPVRLPLRRRLSLWLRDWRVWRILRALRGPRVRYGTDEDFGNQRIADGIKQWARRGAYWLVVPAVSVPLYLIGGRVLARAPDLDGSLRSVLTAASLTSGLLAAGLMNATSQVKELRRRRIDELRTCQVELQPIQRVFEQLLWDLQNRSTPAFDAKSAALRARAGWEVGKSLEHFLGNIRCVAAGWNEHGEYFGGGKLISVEQAYNIEKAIGDMSGVLGRRKHFMYLVEDLTGAPAGEVYSLEGVPMTKWAGVKYALERIRPQTEDSWRLLPFWEDFVNETHPLAVRTYQIAIEVYLHNPRQLRVMFAHLAWLTVVGVAVPLLAVALPSLNAHKPGLLLVAVGGLLLVLANTLVVLYFWITQRRLQDEGRLEV